MDRLEEKIDKIGTDVAYMRGQWDEAIPNMKKMVITHGEEISALKVANENIKTKIGIIGVLSGVFGTGIVEWAFKHFPIK